MFVIPSFHFISAEIFVLIMAIVLMFQGLYCKRSAATFWLLEITLVGAALITLYLYQEPKSIAFFGAYIHDEISSLLKLFIYLTAGVTFAYSRNYIRERNIMENEYYLLGLFSVLGMMLLVSAHDFLMLYLGLELMTLPLYAMVALRRDIAIASESAMKFFVMGAIASGMLLYGISMLYGVTGSIEIYSVAKAYTVLLKTPHNLIVLVGVVFIVVGLLFKFGAAPFHMWVPDVYHGSHSAITLFISCAPKLAALGMAIRVLAEAMPSLHVEWQPLLIIAALLSLAIGNVVAIAQTNIKRMLAYSSIAHMGYMLLGLIAGTTQGFGAALFYIVIYSLSSLGAFGVVVLMSKSGFEAENIEDFRGLNHRNPWLAFLVLLLMFSMAGIPPTVGFFAKLSVINALINVNLVWLAVVSLMFSVIGAFYYIRIVKVMYFDSPTEEGAVECFSQLNSLLFSMNGLVILGLGIFPGALLHLCQHAMKMVVL